MPEIQKADPGARRKALWLIAVVAAGALLLAWIELAPAGGGPERFAESPWLLVVMLVMLLVPVAACGAYTWRMGRRVVKAERFPAPGLKVVRDTPVQTGQQARVTGYMMMFLASLMVVSAFAAAALFYLVYRSLTGA